MPDDLLDARRKNTGNIRQLIQDTRLLISEVVPKVPALTPRPFLSLIACVWDPKSFIQKINWGSLFPDA